MLAEEVQLGNGEWDMRWGGGEGAELCSLFPRPWGSAAKGWPCTSACLARQVLHGGGCVLTSTHVAAGTDS